MIIRNALFQGFVPCFSTLNLNHFFRYDPMHHKFRSAFIELRKEGHTVRSAFVKLDEMPMVDNLILENELAHFE